MDAARFIAELPGLWEDFPRSPQPNGLRFDDVIEGIPNLAEENVLALLNLAASLLAPGESYVEVGTYYGASLIGAMRGNVGDFIAIDRFSFPAMTVSGRKLPAANRAGLEETLHRFGVPGATILEGVCFYILQNLSPMRIANKWTNMVSNSAKIVNIIGAHRFNTILRRTRDCVEIACTGILK